MRALVIAAGVVGLALAGCRGWETGEPPIHLNPNMDTQEKGRPYRRDTTGLFADGRMMRTPVPGTVAQGELLEDDQLELGLDADGGMTQKFPASVKLDDPLVRARGKARFQIYCSPCHGAKADGKGTVPARGGLLVPPPSFHDPRLKEMSVGQMYKAIRSGVNNGNMPSYATQIPTEDRWAIIAGVRAYQKELDPKAVDEPGQVVYVKASVASAETGAVLYKAKGCNACHSLDGTRVVGPTWKGIWGRSEQTDKGEVTVNAEYVKESVLTPLAKVVTGFPPAMPPQALDQVEIDSLILFMQQQK